MLIKRNCCRNFKGVTTIHLYDALFILTNIPLVRIACHYNAIKFIHLYHLYASTENKHYLSIMALRQIHLHFFLCLKLMPLHSTEYKTIKIVQSFSLFPESANRFRCYQEIPVEVLNNCQRLLEYHFFCLV